MRIDKPSVATLAEAGQLVELPWKGGVAKSIKTKKKYGTYYYLATWQGLRGEALNIDTNAEACVTCSATGVSVLFTLDPTKYGSA